jgi:hypothetical protein
VHKGDQCQLMGPAQPSHWKVLSNSGSEAAVPSVCFLVPPPNQEAQEAITRWVAWGVSVAGGLGWTVGGRSMDSRQSP